ncbi:MAG: hypothetical protein ACM3P0_19635 [Acidobacteriota bacterium]
MKSLLFVFIVLSMTCFAQLDTLDRVELKNSKIYTGKVIKVTSNTVQLREAVTNLLQEINKSEIKDMKLSNGVTVTFDNTAPAEQQQNVTGSSRTETQTQNTPPLQNPPAQNPPAQNTQTQSTQTQNPPAQNTQTQNPPAQNPPAQNSSSQNQAVGSGRTATGTTTGQTENKTQTEQKSQTENKGQQTQSTQNAAAPAEDSGSGMDTSKIIMLAAGGLVVLLLIGALIF